MSKTKRKFQTNEKRMKRKLEIISARQQLSYEVERAFAISVVASRIDVFCLLLGGYWITDMS